MATADNDKFLRLWSEVAFTKIYFCATDYINALYTGYKWFPYNKGGVFRKWYGNNEYIVNWQNDGFDIKNNKDEKSKKIRSHNYNGKYGFLEGITWSSLSTGSFSLRYSPKGFLFDSKGAKGFPNNSNEIWFIMGLLNSQVAKHYLSFIAPTIDYKVGDIIQIPFIKNKENKVNEYVKKNIQVVKKDWDSFETSWDFKKHPLI